MVLAQKHELVLGNVESKQKKPEEVVGFMKEVYLLYREKKYFHVAARGSFVFK